MHSEDTHLTKSKSVKCKPLVLKILFICVCVCVCKPYQTGDITITSRVQTGNAHKNRSPICKCMYQRMQIICYYVTNNIKIVCTVYVPICAVEYRIKFSNAQMLLDCLFIQSEHCMHPVCGHPRSADTSVCVCVCLVCMCVGLCFYMYIFVFIIFSETLIFKQWCRW